MLLSENKYDDDDTTISLYFRDFTLSAPPGPIMIFMILFDFRAPSVQSLTGNDAILVSG